MQNIATSQLSDPQAKFIEDLATMLSIWSMPRNAARLYGYLQLRNEPASLDEISRDLEMSRSNAFNAAKMLESHGNAKRLAERGSKRIRFVAGDDPGLPLRPQAEMLGRMATYISAHREHVAQGEAVERLDRLAKFHRRMNAAMQELIQPEGRDAAD